MPRPRPVVHEPPAPPEPQPAEPPPALRSGEARVVVSLNFDMPRSEFERMKELLRSHGFGRAIGE